MTAAYGFGVLFGLTRAKAEAIARMTDRAALADQLEAAKAEVDRLVRDLADADRVSRLQTAAHDALAAERDALLAEVEKMRAELSADRMHETPDQFAARCAAASKLSINDQRAAHGFTDRSPAERADTLAENLGTTATSKE